MGHVDPGLCHEPQLEIVHLHAVGDGHVVVEHTQLGQVDHGALSELGHEALRIQ